MEPLDGVWRTEDRLHTDDETISRLMAAAAADPEVAAIIDDIGPAQAGNGSVRAFAVARNGRAPVVLKLGAGGTERSSMAAIDASAPGVVPRVFGSGVFGGVGWLVLERCGVSLDRMSPRDVGRVITATARFHWAAERLTVALPTMDPDWPREHLRFAAEVGCPGNVEAALCRVEEHWELVVARCGLSANHGDVHCGNAVARHTDGPALLVDPMPIRTVWAWDAAYLEANIAPYRAHDPTGGGTHLVQQLAKERSALGSHAAEELDRVEEIVLGWAAALWWRIAPWRHDIAAWRSWVEHHVESITAGRP